MSEYEKKGWFTVTLPEGWEADESEDPVTFYHADGVGALQATVQAPRPLKPGSKVDVFLMLRAFLQQTGVDIDSIEARRYSDRGLDWATCEYAGESPEEEDLVWRVWMATNHDLVAFFTYACREEEKELERAAVDGILASLRLS
jgi:hypothetical protein